MPTVYTTNFASNNPYPVLKQAAGWFFFLISLETEFQHLSIDELVKSHIFRRAIKGSQANSANSEERGAAKAGCNDERMPRNAALNFLRCSHH